MTPPIVATLSHVALKNIVLEHIKLSNTECSFVTSSICLVILTATSLSTQYPNIALQYSKFSQCIPAPSSEPQIVNPAPSTGP